MRVLAHRGVTTSARENTAAAFAAAQELGVDGFETDVRRTKDGALVLYHDRNLPDGRPLADLAYAELKHEHPELQILKVEEALARWPNVVWNLEVKSATAMEPLVSLLKRSPPKGEVLISSFDHAALEHATPPPMVHLGALVSHRPFGSAKEPLGHWPRVAGLDTIVWAHDLLDRREVDQALARGVRSVVWGAKTAAEHAALQGLPLWAVITDHPELKKRAPPKPRPSQAS
jgi:glycerophosphoryl diester phosphodiesterase